MAGSINLPLQPPVWKWNVHAPWEHFSSMVRSDAEARESRSEFHRNHHVRTALYFAIGSLEALLNRMMRAKMQAEGSDEAAIMDKVRKAQFFDKAKKWPAEITGSNFILPGHMLEALDEFNKLRGEVTHDKRKDHSLYNELDALVLKATLVSTIAESMANLMIANGEEYQYWLHGWNVVGMNGNPEGPICDNNPQFVHLFRSLGFCTEPILMDANTWASSAMRQLKTFQSIDAFLRKLNYCQREDPEFPMMGRLCRRWWDTKHVWECGKRPA
jgi:hypothetical protein